MDAVYIRVDDAPYDDREMTGRPWATGAWANVLLALLAYNVKQLSLDRHLGLDPKKPGRTWDDLRRDIWESLYQLLRKPSERPRRPLANPRRSKGAPPASA